MSRTTQDGLGWEQTPFELVPVWTRDPTISSIQRVCRAELKISPDEPCSVKFYAEGLFNKIFLVKTVDRTLAMRITLPVCPSYKTRAEVATLLWISGNTRIPVPEIFGFDDRNDNEIGFEWILMEFMPGVSAQKRWRTMTMDQKTALAKQLAIYQFELSGLNNGRIAFEKIGTLDAPNIKLEPGSQGSPVAVKPESLVSYEFFLGDRLKYDVPRGPFRTSHDWLDAVLTIISQHQIAVLQSSSDQSDLEEAEEILQIAGSLRAFLPSVFPPEMNESGPEPSMLFHHDLNLNNILVNDDGAITAILDWECVSAMPRWMLSCVPKFLDQETREDEPERDGYGDETPEEAAQNDPDDPHYLDNEGKNQLYWIHKMEYEATQLRKVYRATLSELCPELAEERPLQIDFYGAVGLCEGWCRNRVRRWVKSMERGETIRLQDI